MAGKSICLISEVRSHVILSNSLNFLRINVLLKIPEGINQQKFHPDNKSWFKHWSKVFNIGMSKVFRNKSEKIIVYAPLFEKETRCSPSNIKRDTTTLRFGHSRFPALLGCCSLLVLTVSSDRLFVTFLPCSDWQLWLLSFVWSTLCKTLCRKSECPKIKWWGQRLWDNRACRLSNARPPYASYVVNLAWQSKEWLRRRKRELFLERKRNCGAVSAGVITRSFDFITCIGILRITFRA